MLRILKRVFSGFRLGLLKRVGLFDFSVSLMFFFLVRWVWLMLVLKLVWVEM